MVDNKTTTIDCHTCVATGTTACSECIVGYLLANESGPIALVVPGPLSKADSEVARAIDLIAAAGLLDDPPVFVTSDEFASCSVAEPALLGGRR